MKIGVYARGLSEGGGGPRQVIESMTKSIIKYLDDHSELFILHNCEKKMFKTENANVKEILLKSKTKFFSDYFLLPREVNKLDLDVIWFPKNVIPYNIKAKKIVTILDLIYYMPQYNAYPFIDTAYMRLMIKSSCNRAELVTTISENTKKDLIRFLGINETKIETLYPAADERYCVVTDKEKLDKIREKYDLKSEFILFAGVISPRKNSLRLFQAFNQISKDIPHELVLTGGEGWKNKKEKEQINANKRIKRLGNISNDDMPYLYNLADICVYPSLYEGFGLPILEAQACGCPVICSDVSSIPEVGGEAVLYVDPISTSDIADKIKTLISDGRLRNELITKGFENIKRFSWDTSAEQLLNLCNTVTAGQ